MWPELQTMRMTYQQITKGERPWNALGDFLNYWFGYAPDRREELVKDPIQEPEGPALDLHQWAVFCAASVEYLCQRSGLPCPDWVTAPGTRRTLARPLSLHTFSTHLRTSLAMLVNKKVSVEGNCALHHKSNLLKSIL